MLKAFNVGGLICVLGQFILNLAKGYGLRMSLSAKNHCFDEESRVYIIFTVEEVMELLSCSKQKAVKLLAELDSTKGIGLIRKKRRGLGQEYLIRVKLTNS